MKEAKEGKLSDHFGRQGFRFVAVRASSAKSEQPKGERDGIGRGAS
jgi:hypothetical protein